MRKLCVSFGALGLVVACAGKAWAADPPPPPPASAPAYSVVGGCGCCPQPSTCCPPRDPCRPGHLEIQVHASMLTPDPEGPLGFPGSTVTWDSLEYDIAIGGRVAYTHPFNDWDVTLAGTWWGQWEDDSAGLSEEATLWDLNLTATTPFYCTPCFTADWGFGLRYLRFEEEASFTILTGVIAVFVNSFASDIDNSLLAPELTVGGTWKLSPSFDVTARASVFAGWMRREGEMSSTTAALVDPTGEEDDFGWGGELEVAARWHLGCNWSVSVGYGLLVLGNVTRAHESFDFSGGADVGPVFTDETLLVHRAFVGIGVDF